MLTNNNPTNTHKYADDCTIDEVFANGALSNIQANDNKMAVNKKKTKDMHAVDQFFPIFS
jgi:hypothetical protein